MWNFNEHVIGSRLNHRSSNRGSDIHPEVYHSSFPEVQQFLNVNFLHSPQKTVKMFKILFIYVGVEIATGNGLDCRGVGVRVPLGLRFFSFPRRPDRLWGPPSFLSMGYCAAIYMGVKRLWRETDHSLQLVSR
jgi:hypothetical protein